MDEGADADLAEAKLKGIASRVTDDEEMPDRLGPVRDGWQRQTAVRLACEVLYWPARALRRSVQSSRGRRLTRSIAACKGSTRLLNPFTSFQCFCRVPEFRNTRMRSATAGSLVVSVPPTPRCVGRSQRRARGAPNGIPRECASVPVRAPDVAISRQGAACWTAARPSVGSHRPRKPSSSQAMASTP